jgi:hypothetical protein
MARTAAPQPRAMTTLGSTADPKRSSFSVHFYNNRFDKNRLKLS